MKILSSAAAAAFAFVAFGAQNAPEAKAATPDAIRGDAPVAAPAPKDEPSADARPVEPVCIDLPFVTICCTAKSCVSF